MKINYPACRAFIRCAEPLVTASMIAADADAGFDAGEWSRGSHEKQLQADLGDLYKAIAPRFGMTAEQLYVHVNRYEHAQLDRFLLSVFTKE